MSYYSVTVNYRADNGMNYGRPTDSATVTIEADTELEARFEAIDWTYATFPIVSHVSIWRISKVELD